MTASAKRKPIDPRRRAMVLSLLATGVMLVGKLGAYFATGSAAIFSDAAESVIHVAATVMAAISLWYAAVPADRIHPYGHGKISFFSAGFEGALILVAAIGVIYTGARGLILGVEPHDLGFGLLVIILLTLINLALGLYLVHIGKKHNSIIVEANGRHVLTDMWTSAGVVLGVALVLITKQAWLDPLIAIALGINILISAIRLISRSFQGLMDVAEPGATHKIRDCLHQAVEDGRILGFHQLRHRRANDEIWIEVHLLMAGQIPLAQAHRKVNVIEGLLAGLFPQDKVHVTSHFEPIDHDRAHPGGHMTLDDPLDEEE